MVASGCGDGTVRVHSAAAGRLAYTLSPGGGLGLPITAVRWRPVSSVSSTRNVLLVGGSDGYVRHWHVTSGKVLHEVHEKDNQIFAVDYRPDGSGFATAGKDKVVRLYSESTKQITSILKGGESSHGHANRVFSLKFHPTQEHLLLSGGWDNTVQLWDDRTPGAVSSIYGPHIAGDSIDVFENTLLTGSWRPEDPLELWDLRTLQKTTVVDWGNVPGENALLYSAEFSKDGSVFAAGGSGTNEVKVFDTASTQCVGTARLDSAAYTLDWAPSTRLLAVGGGQSGLKILSMRSMGLGAA